LDFHVALTTEAVLIINMHLVTFSNRIDVTFAKTAGKLERTVEPNVPYVFSLHQFRKLVEGNTHIGNAAIRTTIFDSRLKPFIAGEKAGEKNKVLFYTGAGGYGDQIMAWPAAKALHDRGYELNLLADPGNEKMWERFDWVKSVRCLPIQYDQIRGFDHIVLFETVTNLDEHTDQLHPTDNLLTRLGIEPASLPDDRKAVQPVFSPEELAKAAEFVNGRQLAVYQLSASAVTRSLPADVSRQTLVGLARAFPQFHWIGTYDPYNKEPYFQPIPDCPPNLELKTFDSIRVFMAVVSQAKLAVGPDSLLVHVAGVFGVPCVGLWGTVDPVKRVRYYQKRHLAIWQRQACAFSPCYHGDPDAFPTRCPPLPNRTICAVMELNVRVINQAVQKCLQVFSSR